MDPILVPSPPRSAYNQNRRVSDLLLGQLKHFQHVEIKRKDLGIDSEIARNIHTEAGAARYIAAMTNALRGTKAMSAAGPRRPAVITQKTVKKPPIDSSLTIAAGADQVTSAATTGKSPKRKAAVKSPSDKPSSSPVAGSAKRKQ